MIVKDMKYGSVKLRVDRMRQHFRARIHRKFRADIAILDAFIPSTGVLLDIGANHGRFGLELARQRPGCMVHAFEPFSNSYEMLTSLARSQANLVPHRFGLSNRQSQIQFVVPIRASGVLGHGGAFVPEPEQIQTLEAAPERYLTEQVMLRPLDDVVDELGLNDIGFLKIDVQGHELSVLQGAARMLVQHKPTILAEVSPGEYSDSGDSLMSELRAIGYGFYDLDLCDDGEWTLDPADIARKVDVAGKHHDVLCYSPKEKGPLDPCRMPAFSGSFARTRYGN